MKWLRSIVLFDRGDVLSTPDWQLLHESYVRSILSIDFPPGSRSLTLRKKSKQPNGKWKRNGVGYLKESFLANMVQHEKWVPESSFSLDSGKASPTLKLYPSFEDYQEPITSEFGSFDFVTTTPNKTRAAIEWETGNISSSHRSLNKLVIALITNHIDVGVLIVPSRDLYEHLTDRIGNIKELSGYLTMWRRLAVQVDRGALIITVVEHDHLVSDVTHPYMVVGEDGNSARGATKRTK